SSEQAAPTKIYRPLRGLIELERAFAQRRLPHNAPAPDTPCPSAELNCERSLHQTTAWHADSQNAKPVVQSFAPAHSWRSACIKWAGLCLHPTWEPHIRGCNDRGRYSTSVGIHADDPDVHRPGDE